MVEMIHAYITNIKIIISVQLNKPQNKGYTEIFCIALFFIKTLIKVLYGAILSYFELLYSVFISVFVIAETLKQTGNKTQYK